VRRARVDRCLVARIRIRPARGPCRAARRPPHRRAARGPARGTRRLADEFPHARVRARGRGRWRGGPTGRRGARSPAAAALGRVRGGPELASGLDEGFRLERLGWTGSGGTAVASVPALREFCGEVARWAAARGWLRLFLLRIDGRALAFYYGLEHRHVLH